MDWSDDRKLEDLTFGMEAPPAARAAVAERVRAILARCMVKIADDIAALGCTGLAGWHSAPGSEPQIAEGRFVRMALAGSGVGLACFVTSDRYCLIHETIGGLQEGQAQRHAEFAERISRALTEAEKFKLDLIERVRRLDPKEARKATDILSGRELPQDLLADDASDAAPVVSSAPPEHPDVCSEHPKKTVWACRYCLAAEIVNGSLLPVFVLQRGVDDFTEVSSDSIENEVRILGEGGLETIELFVRVARWSYKLARD